MVMHMWHMCGDARAAHCTQVRRRDWLESMIHHVVTVGLLAYSYYVNFTRVGIMIMLVHDISDIFLEISKLSRYAKRQVGRDVGEGESDWGGNWHPPTRLATTLSLSLSLSLFLPRFII